MKNWSLISLFVLLSLLTCHTWFGPDIWYHMTWGRDVIERLTPIPMQRSLFAQPLIANIYWFFQTTVYGVFRIGGPFSVSIFFSILWLCIGLVWCRVAGVAKTWLGPLFFLAFIVCIQLRFDQRPEVYAYLFLILQIWILQDLSAMSGPFKRRLVGLFFLEVLMANSHGYFALGPMLGGAFLVGELLRGSAKTQARLQRAAAVFGALALGSLVSPSPLGGWEMVVGYEKVGRAMAETNVEMFPTYRIAMTWSIQVFWIYWSIVLAALVFKIWRRQLDFSFILAAAGAYLSFRMLRNIPLFLLFAAPLTHQILSALDQSVWLKSPKRRLHVIHQTVFSVFVLALCLFTVRGDYHRGSMSLSQFGYGVEWASYPIGATEYLRGLSFQGNLFTDSYDGGYVEFQLPSIKIAGDSYFYDPAVTARFFEAIKKPGALLTANDEFHFDGLIINIENTEIVQHLWKSTQWVFAYADSHRIVFLAAGKFAKYQTQTSRPIYYHGDDLRHWMYAFSPITWMQTALRFGDQGLARKVMNDCQIATTVPSTFVRAALLFALTHQDPFLAKQALNLWPRSYVSDPADPAAIEKLSRAVSSLN